MPLISPRDIIFSSSGLNTFPSVILISRSGSKVPKIDLTISSRPLNTESIIIRAIVPTITPATDIDEIILIAFLDFLAKRYLRDI